MLFADPLISQPGVPGLQELAPTARSARLPGFIGPVPPPLAITGTYAVVETAAARPPSTDIDAIMQARAARVKSRNAPAQGRRKVPVRSERCWDSEVRLWSADGLERGSRRRSVGADAASGRRAPWSAHRDARGFAALRLAALCDEPTDQVVASAGAQALASRHESPDGERWPRPRWAKPTAPDAQRSRQVHLRPGAHRRGQAATVPQAFVHGGFSTSDGLRSPRVQPAMARRAVRDRVPGQPRHRSSLGPPSAGFHAVQPPARRRSPRARMGS